MHVDLRRLRPPDLVALFAGMLLVVSLFLPWYQFPAGSRDAFSALTVSELPAALAASSRSRWWPSRSPSARLPYPWRWRPSRRRRLCFRGGDLGPHRGASGFGDGRCYGLWLALAGAVLVTGAAFLSLRDESPFWASRQADDRPRHSPSRRAPCAPRAEREEVARLTIELGAVLEHIETISRLDLEGVPPTST